MTSTTAHAIYRPDNWDKITRHAQQI